uniref:Uncharacterized protein n=2 Tax=Calcidiscus leptoporus TaxID=127549 RepID=A0A7S0JJP1_9EUKA
MVFLKLGFLAIVTAVLFTLFLAWTVFSLWRLNRQLTIQAPVLVHGDAHVHVGANEVDLAALGTRDVRAGDSSRGFELDDRASVDNE